MTVGRIGAGASTKIERSFQIGFGLPRGAWTAKDTPDDTP